MNTERAVGVPKGEVSPQPDDAERPDPEDLGFAAEPAEPAERDTTANVEAGTDDEPDAEPDAERTLLTAARRYVDRLVTVRFGAVALTALVLLCAATLLIGFWNKDRCAGPHYDSLGRTTGFLMRADRYACYSDVQYLWVGRDINEHVFPYIHGGIDATGQLFGGSVEYPVLTGLLMWLGAFFAHNDHEFLIDSSLLLAPFGLLTAWLLGRLARWRSLVWALGPPLVLYAFHNWDLAVVACAVGAAYVVHRGWGRAGPNRSLASRSTMAAVLLGLGFAFKLYPLIFVVPLMLYVATGGAHGAEHPPRLAGHRWNLLGPIRVALVALGTVLLVNLPFMLAGYAGWRASFTFQEDRAVDITTNSIWFWGFRPYSDPSDKEFQSLVDVLSPALIIAAFVLACVLGWRRYRREGSYPWLAVCAAMLCGFLLFHKVHSPQYTLWLVPMFVLLRVRWGWIAAYFVADAAMGLGIFRYYYAITFGKPYGIYDGLAEQATVIGVWGRAALLVGLFFAFLAATPVTDAVPDRPDGRAVRSIYTAAG